MKKIHNLWIKSAPKKHAASEMQTETARIGGISHPDKRTETECRHSVTRRCRNDGFIIINRRRRYNGKNVQTMENFHVHPANDKIVRRVRIFSIEHSQYLCYNQNAKRICFQMRAVMDLRCTPSQRRFPAARTAKRNGGNYETQASLGGTDSRRQPRCNVLRDSGMHCFCN
jgi:hypothetical protein